MVAVFVFHEFSNGCCGKGISDTHKVIEAVWKIEATRLIAGIARVTRDMALRRNSLRMRLLQLSNGGRTKGSRKNLPRG
jgi:hypothetical protein